MGACVSTCLPSSIKVRLSQADRIKHKHVTKLAEGAALQEEHIEVCVQKILALEMQKKSIIQHVRTQMRKPNTAEKQRMKQILTSLAAYTRMVDQANARLASHHMSHERVVNVVNHTQDVISLEEMARDFRKLGLDPTKAENTIEGAHETMEQMDEYTDSVNSMMFGLQVPVDLDEEVDAAFEDVDEEMGGGAPVPRNTAHTIWSKGSSENRARLVDAAAPDSEDGLEEQTFDLRKSHRQVHSDRHEMQELFNM
jgi:uncharacterized protein (DUF2384 family)